MMAPGRSLIVGSLGQVGTQIAAMLGAAGCIGTSRRKATPETIQLDLASLTAPDAEALLGSLAARAVYCAGGATDVERCESEAGLAVRINCEGPALLAAAAAARGIPFVYFSTEYVFNGIGGPYSEEAPGDPLNIYGKSKWLGELAIRQAHPRHLILRTTVVYGPDPNGRNFLCGLRRAIEAGQTLRVANDQISTPTYNRDLAAAAVALVNAGATGTFHVCGPERLSRLDFARRAAGLMGFSETLIAGVPTSELGQRAPRPLDAGLSAEKLRDFDPKLRMRSLNESWSDWMAA